MRELKRELKRGSLSKGAQARELKRGSSSEGAQEREQEGRLVSKHQEGIQSEPCPGGACFLSNPQYRMN